MLDRAGDLGMLSEVEQRVFAEAVQPESAARIAISDTHRDHSNVGGMPARVQGCGNDFACD